MSYADSHDLNTHDIPSIAKHMANLPKKNNKRKRVAIVTQGTDPTIIAIQGEDEVKTFPVHKIDGKEIVDTTGAGDAFAGGFFAGIAKGEKLETCVDMGQWLAAQSLRELGPSYVPDSKSDDMLAFADMIPDIPSQPRLTRRPRKRVRWSHVRIGVLHFPVFQQP